MGRGEVVKASGSPREGEQAKRPRFWMGPLVAGACFALGYGITQRLIVMQDTLREPRREAFATQAFPGERLEALRLSHGDWSQDLAADVAAKEAELAQERQQQKAMEEAERLAAEERRRAEPQTLLQAVATDPVLPEPAWAEPELTMPAPVLPKPEPKPAPVAAEPAAAPPPSAAPVLAEPAPPLAPPSP